MPALVNGIIVITAGIATKPAVINAANSQFKTVRVTLDPSIKYEIPGIKIESFEKFLKNFGKNISKFRNKNFENCRKNSEI
jgi:hypothetical protein